MQWAEATSAVGAGGGGAEEAVEEVPEEEEEEETGGTAQPRRPYPRRRPNLRLPIATPPPERPGAHLPLLIMLDEPSPRHSPNPRLPISRR